MVSFNISLSLLLLGAVHQVTSHMAMKSPPPRKSKFNRNYQESQFDYSYTAPLGSEFPYPCRGYGKGPSSADAQAGQSLPVQLYGEAPHNGGHCQFAISYNDKDWVVLKTVMGNCLTGGLNYDVPIPSDAPNGPATIAWGWINRTGNREYYMNCADVTVKGGKEGGSITGKKLFVANLPGYETFPEGFADDYGKDKIEGMPVITISPNGSNPGPVNPPPVSQSQPSSQSYTANPPSSASQNKPEPSSTSQNNPSPVPTSSEAQKPVYPTEVSQSQNKPPVYPTEVSQSQNKPPVYPTQVTSESPKPTYNEPAPSKPSSPPTGEKCQHGTLRCGDKGLEICSYNKYYNVGCPLKTTCQTKYDRPGCYF